MIWHLAPQLPDWLAAKFIDALDAGQDIPEVMAAWGIVSIVLGAVALTWMVASAHERRRAESESPEPESLTDAHDWLVDHEEPEPVRTPRRAPSPLAIVLKRPARYQARRRMREDATTGGSQ